LDFHQPFPARGSESKNQPKTGLFRKARYAILDIATPNERIRR